MADSSKKHYYILILCGGGGKRLWPRSRVKLPKQFIRMFGRNTIFHETLDRAYQLVPHSHVFVVTTKEYIDDIHREAPQLDRENIIVEPFAKNTAMAIGLATTIIHQKDPLAVISNFASDHVIDDFPKFEKAIFDSLELADSGDYLVTIGIKPLFPHPGLGYVKAGALFKEFEDFSIFKVDKFIEKPGPERAEAFFKSGEYYWNASMYTWKAESILRAIKKYLPKVSAALDEISQTSDKENLKKVIENVYEKAEDISIDYGVSENADNMLVIPAEFKWNDVGDWKAVYDLGNKDKNGNVIICENDIGDFVGLETTNCLIHFSDQLVATIGVDDLIIIDTKDALLIARKDKTQEVKNLVSLLGESKLKKYT